MSPSPAATCPRPCVSRATSPPPALEACRSAFDGVFVGSCTSHRCRVPRDLPHPRRPVPLGSHCPPRRHTHVSSVFPEWSPTPCGVPCARAGFSASSRCGRFCADGARCMRPGPAIPLTHTGGVPFVAAELSVVCRQPRSPGRPEQGAPRALPGFGPPGCCCRPLCTRVCKL